MKAVLTKQELFDTFDGKISKTCLTPDQSEPPGHLIQGKYCWIQTAFDWGADAWNIWIGNPFDMEKGLGQQKVRNIARVLAESHTTDAYRELTGEADCIVHGKQTILENLKVLGIAKKREYSPEQIAKKKTALAEARNLRGAI